MKKKSRRYDSLFWFSLSIVVAVIFCLPALQIAFSSEYVAQDDARQHVFWTYRFIDPELFPNDLITDYFQSVAPWGYKNFYWLTAKIGIDPLLLHKILPLILAIVTTGYFFGLCLAILPIPFAAFLGCFLLNQTLWLRDDLVSATPTAFVYPFLVAFFYYLLRESLLPCLGAIALQGLFYPQAVFISLGVLFLRLFRLQRWRLRLFSQKRNIFFLAGLAVGTLVMLPYALKTSEYGSVVSLEAARQLPEFYAGWSQYFSDSWIYYWLCGIRSGFFPLEWCSLTQMSLSVSFFLIPPALIAAIILPILRFVPNRFPLVKRINSDWLLIPQIILVSLGMFIASHVLLFRLHLPSRYTEHNWRIVISLAGGIALAAIVDAMIRWIKQHQTQLFSKSVSLFLALYWLIAVFFWFVFAYPGGKKSLLLWLFLGTVTTLIIARLRQKDSERKPVGKKLLASGVNVLLVFLVLLYPVMYSFILPAKGFPYPVSEYQKSANNRPIHQFFAQQPKDIVIASLSKQQTVIPIFSKRSVLFGGWGFAVPYHRGYYTQIRERASDLLEAQYSPNLADVESTIDKYGVDFWLIERESFTLPYLSANLGLRQFQSSFLEAEASLKSGVVPALSTVVESCSVIETEDLIVLEAECIKSKN